MESSPEPEITWWALQWRAHLGTSHSTLFQVRKWRHTAGQPPCLRSRAMVDNRETAWPHLPIISWAGSEPDHALQGLWSLLRSEDVRVPTAKTAFSKIIVQISSTQVISFLQLAHLPWLSCMDLCRLCCPAFSWQRTLYRSS